MAHLGGTESPPLDDPHTAKPIGSSSVGAQGNVGGVKSDSEQRRGYLNGGGGTEASSGSHAHSGEAQGISTDTIRAAKDNGSALEDKASKKDKD